ncbi:MAG: hypothetical protein IPK97_00030 [Ahniella sp.]|nr:hypothetical protein [Ahniella sp.]
MLSLRATTCLSILATTLLLSPTQAATLRWPGPSAPCAASLQACIDGAADGDTILVTDAAFPITGTLSIAKSLTLSSDVGARARFENAILSVTATRAGGQVTRLRKLHLTNSQVSVVIGNSNAADVFDLSMSELHISAPGNSEAIGISPVGTGSDNRVSLTHSRLSGKKLVSVPSGLPDTRLSISVRNNNLNVSRATHYGLSWGSMDGGSRLDFIGNRCEGLKIDFASCMAISTARR